MSVMPRAKNGMEELKEVKEQGYPSGCEELVQVAQEVLERFG